MYKPIDKLQHLFLDFNLKYTLQGTHWLLSGTCAGRSDIPNQRKQELLQRAWDPAVRTKARQTKCRSKN